jgi:hypothetical protein
MLVKNPKLLKESRMRYILKTFIISILITQAGLHSIAQDTVALELNTPVQFEVDDGDSGNEIYFTYEGTEAELLEMRILPSTLGKYDLEGTIEIFDSSNTKIANGYFSMQYMWYLPTSGTYTFHLTGYSVDSYELEILSPHLLEIGETYEATTASPFTQFLVIRPSEAFGIRFNYTYTEGGPFLNRINIGSPNSAGSFNTNAGELSESYLFIGFPVREFSVVFTDVNAPFYVLALRFRASDFHQEYEADNFNIEVFTPENPE